MRAEAIINPVAFTLGEKSNVFQKIIFLNITGAVAQNIFANFLIFGQALMLNQLFIKHRLSKEITLFAGLFYILFVSIMPENTVLSTALVANTFIILALFNILDTYKLPQATAKIFNAGVMIGMASVFYSAYFTFIIFGIIALLQLRSFKIYEKLQFIIGVGIPYFLLFTYRYWFGIKFLDLDFIKEIFFRMPVIRTEELILFYLSFAVLLGSVVYVFLNYNSLIAKKSIQVQKKIDILFWLLLFTLISFLVFNTENVYHLVIVALPLSLLVAAQISDSKYKLFYEVGHIFILSLIFISHYKLINF